MFSGKKKCLSEFEIGSYIDGKLSSEKKDVIEKHFVECKKCWNEFISIQRVITAKAELDREEVAEGMIRKVVNMFPEKSSLFDIVLNLVSDAVKVIQLSTDFTQLTPIPAEAVRGEEDIFPRMVILKRSFEEINVELDIEKISEDLCNIRVSVDDLTSKGLMNTLRIALLSEGRELFSTLLENGKAVLEDVSAGKYIIKIHKSGKTFGEITLKIQ